MHKKFVLEAIDKFNPKHSRREVFEDFIISCAYAMANHVDFNKEREEKYFQIENKYTKEEVALLADMLIHTALDIRVNGNHDILGQLYEELGLSSKNLGQFFTPLNVCDLMSKITLDEKSVKEIVKENGFISLNDPACGSGRLLISGINTVVDYGIDINKIFVEGDDLSMLCSCMTYLNLSLMGVSGIVKIKNSLSNEEYDTFYTPCYAANKKLRYIMNSKKETGEELENG